jgi:D-alanyl-D-alanine carboxypeptidase
MEKKAGTRRYVVYRQTSAGLLRAAAFCCSLSAATLAAACGSSSVAGVTTPASPPVSSTVPPDIRAIMDKAAYKNSTWGLRVTEGSKVLVDLNSDRQFLIGSVRKIFSVAELLTAVGGSHTYDTPVYRDGTISNGVLNGNLYVVASGDLTMGGRTNPDGTIAISDWDHNEADSLGNAVLTKPNPLAGYETLARGIKASGIRRVAGNIVIDDRLFVPFRFRNEVDVKSIFVNDDLVDLSIVPGSNVTVTTRPHSVALTINNQLRTGSPKSKDTLAIDPLVPSCIGEPGCTSTIEGSLPSNFVPPLTGEPVLVQTVRIAQPSNYARTVLIEALETAGVTVDAPVVAENPVKLLPAKGSYQPANKVAQLTGLPYADDAKLVLKISYNIGADTSLVLFGLTHNVDTMTAALEVERANLSSNYGIAPSEYHFIDGSGGGDTTATNGAVITMLDKIAAGPAYRPVFDALPILGVDGSLAFVKNFQSNPTLAGATGKVRAKTGTYVAGTNSGLLLKAQALGGYVTTRSGKRLAFELVVNDVPIKDIDSITRIFQDQGTISAMLWRDY